MTSTTSGDPHHGHEAHSISESCIPQCPLYVSAEDRHVECIKDVFRDNVRLRAENERLRNVIHWFESQHGIDDDRVQEFFALLGGKR